MRIRTFLSTLGAFLIVGSAARADFERRYDEMQVHCLARNVYFEARGEPTSAQIMVALVTLARLDDSDPQWPKSVCRVVHQWGQFSWANGNIRFEKPFGAAWMLAQMIARDVYALRWKAYKLPRGWECVRYFKKTDDTGVSERGRRYFATLVSVGRFGSHTAYRERSGCKTPMPTA